MKHILLTFLAILCSTSALAQGLTGKILVIADSAHSDYFAKDLRSYYSGVVVTRDTLDLGLQNFDAVILGKDLPVSDQFKVIDYLKLDGQLSYPYPIFWGDSVRDTLLHYLGVEHILYTAAYVWFDGYYGVDSEFTFGIKTSWEHTDPTQFDASGVPCPLGKIVPIFFKHIGTYDGAMVTAWVPQNRSIKAVVGSGIPPFNQRMFCNYFGLCAPMSVAKSTVPIHFKVIPNPARTSITISLPEERESSVEIADVLGNVLLRKQAMGQMQWKPEHDAPAVYFVRVATPQADGTASVSTQRVVFE